MDLAPNAEVETTSPDMLMEVLGASDADTGNQQNIHLKHLVSFMVTSQQHLEL
jgi:hypothetical protein